MKKEMNNKGFSLVELIIVVAIMAVLIGVLAPAYLQYVEKSKKTKDCSAIGSVMDAMEIVASDPAVTWTAKESITAVIGNGESATTTYTADASMTDATKLNELLEGIVDPDKTKLSGSWGGITFTGTKQTNGTVEFKITSTGDLNRAAIGEISPALEARFEA